MLVSRSLIDETSVRPVNPEIQRRRIGSAGAEWKPPGFRSVSSRADESAWKEIEKNKTRVEVAGGKGQGTGLPRR